MSAAAAALMAFGMANAKSGEHWHQLNCQKFKERQIEIIKKYQKILSKEDSEIMISLQESLESTTLPESEKCCPECQRHFSLITIANLEIDACKKCHSFWFDTHELLAFTHSQEDIPSSHLTSRPSKYKCPVCNSTMKECVYQVPNNLLVDQCSEHGVYLENKELDRVVEISQ